MSILPVWRKNRELDLSEVVDSNKLFEFVDSLLYTKDNWVFSFEFAQDICATLKQQSSYLFMDCLDIRSRIKPGMLGNKDFSEVSAKSLQIIIDKPCGWEYRLFAQLLKDYIERYADIRRDLFYGVSFARRTSLDNYIEVADFISKQCKHITATVTSSTKLLNEGLPIAFGERGKPGDVKHINYIAKRFTQGYKRLIEWRLEFFALDVDYRFNKHLALTSLMATNAIREIEDYANYVHKEIKYVFDNIDTYEEGTKIRLILTLTLPDTAEFYEELEKTRVEELEKLKGDAHL